LWKTLFSEDRVAYTHFYSLWRRPSRCEISGKVYARKENMCPDFFFTPETSSTDVSSFSCHESPTPCHLTEQHFIEKSAELARYETPKDGVQSVQSVEKEATCWCQDCKMDLCF
jgi:hypothetical protein